MSVASIKPVVWIGSARADLAFFPEDVKDAVGYALYLAQRGEKHPDAKPLRGFGDAGTLEIVEDHAGDTYRAVYTVRLAGRVYVLHAFQKKSKKGIRTPQYEIELIKARLKRAEAEHARWLETQRKWQDEEKDRGRRK
jgi:phage-related protein